MKGDVAGQQLILQMPVVQRHHDRPQGFLSSADHGVGRGVLAGDLYLRRLVGVVLAAAEGDTQFRQQVFHARTVEADRQHAARSGGPLLERGAMKHQTRGFLQRQRPARIGRRDLARTMADHAIRIDAPGLEQLHQGALDHVNDRLRQLNLVQLGLRGAEAGLAQRDFRMFAPMRLDGIDGPPEHGLGVIQVATAPCPLGALTGKHHRHAAPAIVDRVDRRQVFDKGLKRFDQFLAVPDRE